MRQSIRVKLKTEEKCWLPEGLLPQMSTAWQTEHEWGFYLLTMMRDLPHRNSLPHQQHWGQPDSAGLEEQFHDPCTWKMLSPIVWSICHDWCGILMDQNSKIVKVRIITGKEQNIQGHRPSWINFINIFLALSFIFLFHLCPLLCKKCEPRKLCHLPATAALPRGLNHQSLFPRLPP